jgi:AbrB family looped-hinge helix DNA binding protein
MRATIDREGRIVLGRELQSQLGLQPGDDVLVERSGEEWILKPAKSKSGLCLEGNVLVHCGVLAPSSDDFLADFREERLAQLSEGLAR